MIAAIGGGPAEGHGALRGAVRRLRAELGFESVTTDERWRNLPADQSVKTPTKPALYIRSNAVAGALITSVSFRLVA